jgi:hypothetical protein
MAAPVALHATPISGQLSIEGTVVNNGSVLTFVPGTSFTGYYTQTGTFATLLSDHEAITSGPSTISFTPYVPGSAVIGITPLTITLLSLVDTQFMLNGSVIDAFSGSASFAAPGYDTTMGIFSFSTQASGPVTFSATGLASPVPEPSTLALFGTGALGLAGLVSKKFIA